MHGILVGWHRDRLASTFARHRRLLLGGVVALAAASALGLLAGQLLLGPAAWEAWERTHFDKGTLDLARIAALMAMTAALYLSFRRYEHRLNRVAAPLLLPLGQNSFYVFIMHVFVCLAIASVPLLAGGGLGLVGNSVVEIAALGLLWLMVRRRFLFRWVPR